MSTMQPSQNRTVRTSVRVTSDTVEAIDGLIEQGLFVTRQDAVCRALACFLYHDDEPYDPQSRITERIDHLFNMLQQRIEQTRRERRLYHLFQFTVTLATLFNQTAISKASHRRRSPALADAIDPLDTDYLFGYTTDAAFQTLLDLSLRGSVHLSPVTRSARLPAKGDSHE